MRKDRETGGQSAYRYLYGRAIGAIQATEGRKGRIGADLKRLQLNTCQVGHCRPGGRHQRYHWGTGGPCGVGNSWYLKPLLSLQRLYPHVNYRKIDLRSHLLNMFSATDRVRVADPSTRYLIR
jgi:hypothetical protein